MKEILKTYGSMVIAAMVGLSLIYIICFMEFKDNYGILAIIGDIASEQDSQILINDNESEQYRNYKNSKISQLTLRDDIEIKAGEKNPVTDCFISDAGDIRNDHMEIIAIEDSQGKNCELINENNKDYFYFEEPGIYRVYFSVSNDYGVKDYGSLYLPVNRKKVTG
ncbi:MAG: hypothetical protein UH211_06760 [Agathobacter sp.]|nr:hypothetical protein [Agathobacter sp.]